MLFVGNWKCGGLLHFIFPQTSFCAKLEETLEKTQEKKRELGRVLLQRPPISPPNPASMPDSCSPSLPAVKKQKRIYCQSFAPLVYI